MLESMSALERDRITPCVFWGSAWSANSARMQMALQVSDGDGKRYAKLTGRDFPGDGSARTEVRKGGGEPFHSKGMDAEG